MKKYWFSAFFALVLLSIPGESSAQPVAQWIARYNGLLDSSDISRDIVVDGSGNSYVTGTSYTLLGLLTDIVTISYDSNGNERWRVEYGGLLFDEGTALVLDNTQQFVYVTGYTNSLLGLTLSDFVIIKYRASDGQQIWARTYNGGVGTDDKAVDVAVDNQNNPVITGFSQSFLLLLSPYDYATIKYDQNGNQQWINRFNGSANGEDKSHAIAIDNSDNVVVTGYSTRRISLFTTDEEFTTIKYSPAGTQQWTSSYNGTGGNNSDRSYAIVVDNSGNIIVTGESTSPTGNMDYATVKYDPSGSQQWASRYNGPGNGYDRSYAIVVDNAGNTIVTGESTGSSTGTDYATVKYNPSGSQQWASRYNGPGNSEDRSYAIVVDNSGNSYVTGSSRSGSSSGSEDFATLRYTPAGSQQWVVRYNGSGNNTDRSYAIVVDNPGNVYITGESPNSGLLGSEDYLTIKYADVAGIQAVNNTIPVSYAVYQNYPNPFNPETHIRFDVPEKSFVKISVYDILGTEKEVLISRELLPGTYEVNWNAAGFSSGIYFYRISMNGYIETKKMLLVK